MPYLGEPKTPFKRILSLSASTGDMGQHRFTVLFSMATAGCLPAQSRGYAAPSPSARVATATPAPTNHASALMRAPGRNMLTAS